MENVNNKKLSESADGKGGMVKIDEIGALVTIAENGMVKLDGVTILRKVLRGGRLYLQFCDYDRMRTQLRKTRYVEIPADALIQALIGSQADAPETNPKPP